VRRAALLAPALGLLLLGDPGAEPAAVPPEAAALADKLEAAWKDQDLAAYLALWDWSNADRGEEEGAVRDLFAADELRLNVKSPLIARAATKVEILAEVFAAVEPRARVAEWRFSAERTNAGWRLSSREEMGQVEGLVHLSADPAGFRADGLEMKLEDFELRLHRGTLFTSPQNLGPTLLLFIGEGEVRFQPRPLAEREQLRQFCGMHELRDHVSAIFARIHPADLHRVLVPTRLDPDPEASRRWPAAQRFYRDQSQKAFVLDASLPRSPWWLLPSVGDASVTFETARRGTLTYNVAAGEPEDLTLFDRQKKLQICSYPSGGRDTRYSEDDNRVVDVLSHDLHVRFQPDVFGVSGENTIRLRVLSPVSTVRLRLHDSLRVLSVTSREGGNHLFFRVRDQASLIVSLGPLTGRVGEITLTVRYAGFHDPAPIDQELLQVGGPPLQGGSNEEPEIFLERVPVYTNRTAWYPRGDNDDYATARLRLETPAGMLAISGGKLVASGTADHGSFAEYVLDQPAKYLTAAVGRFTDLGLRQEGDLSLRGFSLSRTRNVAQDYMLLAERILGFFSERFGPCPYPWMNLAVSEWRTPGGHSPPGLILVQLRPTLATNRSLPDDPANFSDVPGFFLAHELAHQWWGQGVAPQNYRERWLSEGWAQYAAALWIRQSRGDSAFRDIMDRYGQWSFRFTELGPINLGHRLGHLRNNPQIFRAVVYDKGAWVLHMLRGLVGEEAFTRGVRAFQAAHHFEKAGTDDFREALEAASGQDLKPYFEAWIYGTSLPEIRYAWKIQSPGPLVRVTLRVDVRDLPGPFPVQITLVGDGARETRILRLPPKGGTFDLELPWRPRRVELNADRALLARVDRVDF
jgi:hypothetical protein